MHSREINETYTYTKEASLCILITEVFRYTALIYITGQKSKLTKKNENLKITLYCNMSKIDNQILYYISSTDLVLYIGYCFHYIFLSFPPHYISTTPYSVNCCIYVSNANNVETITIKSL